MAKWALIINGVVQETTTENPKDRFAEDMQWERCVTSVGEGWTYSSGTFAEPAKSLEDTKAARLAHLADSCAETIVSGYVSDALGADHTYPNGVTDQINMMGSVTASLLPGLGENWSTPFWCADSDGQWAFRMHSSAQIQRAGSDGKAHVVRCQAALDQLSESVMAATTSKAVEAIDWPAA